MTPERARELGSEVARRIALGESADIAYYAILQACAEEREACAKIADKYADSYDYGDGPRIAAAIRGAE